MLFRSYNQTITLEEKVLKHNNKLQEQYKDHFINMIAPVQTSTGKVKVFTNDKHFISQDCRHLTRFGAIYYSEILNLSWILNGF